MQLDMFNYECQTPYVIKKPIRLIELFAGKGAQAKALKRLKANFVHWRICEFDKYAVATYNEIHGTNFKTSDITQITAADLGITDTDKYEYIMTYSFPCTDLSIAGKQKGMTKGSGTRSGLLWEVERLLKECKELPQVLLMENVPQVLNCDFGGWLEFLEGLGYRNYYQKLNAKDYGIPQNRERVFMVSTLGDYYYEFPKPIKLQLRLKDMLEPTVDEKYYLSEKVIENLQLNKDISNAVRSGGRGSTDRHSWDLVEEPVILTPKRTEYGKAIRKEYEVGNAGGESYLYKVEVPYQTPNIIFHDKSYEPIHYKTNNDMEIYYIVVNGKNIGLIKQGDYWYAIRKLTPLECFRLMGFDDEDFYKAKWGADWQTIMNIMNSNWSFEEKAIFINKYKENNSNSQLYKIAGNSIVVQVLEAIFGMMIK